MSLKAAVPTSQKRLDFNQNFNLLCVQTDLFQCLKKDKHNLQKETSCFHRTACVAGFIKQILLTRIPVFAKSLEISRTPNLETIQNDISWRKNVYFELSCCNFGIQIRFNGETGIPIGSLDRSADVDIFTRHHALTLFDTSFVGSLVS